MFLPEVVVFGSKLRRVPVGLRVIPGRQKPTLGNLLFQQTESQLKANLTHNHPSVYSVKIFLFRIMSLTLTFEKVEAWDQQDPVRSYRC